MVINMLLMTCLTYYATYVLGSTAAATLLQAAYLAAYLLTSFVVGAVDKKLGRRKTMMLGAGIAIAGKIWFIIAPAAPGSIYLNAVTVGIRRDLCLCALQHEPQQHRGHHRGRHRPPYRQHDRHGG